MALKRVRHLGETEKMTQRISKWLIQEETTSSQQQQQQRNDDEERKKWTEKK